MRLRLFKPLTTVQIVPPEPSLSESRISLNSCWVEVLKNTVNTEHLDLDLGKVVLQEAPLPLTHNT